MEEEVLVEMKKLSDYMNQQGDITVATFVPTIHGYYVSEIEEQNYCLLKGMRTLERHAMSLGSELSIFHKRGAFFPEEIEQLSRIGEWKALWEKGSSIRKVLAITSDEPPFRCIRSIVY